LRREPLGGGQNSKAPGGAHAEPGAAGPESAPFSSPPGAARRGAQRPTTEPGAARAGRAPAPGTPTLRNPLGVAAILKPGVESSEPRAGGPEPVSRSGEPRAAGPEPVSRAGEPRAGGVLATPGGCSCGTRGRLLHQPELPLPGRLVR